MQPLSVFRRVFLHSWRPFAWLVFSGCLLYAHTVSFSEYTYFDDQVLIAASFSHIDELSDIGHAFLEDAGHQAQGGNLYRPMLTVTFILDAQLSGTSLWAYRLTNILLHTLTCALLFLTLQAFGFQRGPSLVFTLIFCVHPALTQAVSWISGRNDSLLAVFILPCFLFLMRFVAADSLRWFFLHLLFFALAMFTKETSIVVPVLALLLITAKGEKLISLRTVLLLAGWGIVLVNWQILRAAALVAPVGDLVQASKTILSHFWVSLGYLGNIVWPWNIAFAPVEQDISIIPGVAGFLLLIALIAVAERREWGMIFFGVAWFILFLVPTFFHHQNLILPQKFYEHRIYMPLVGILFLLLSIQLPERLKPSRLVQVSWMVLIVGMLGITAFRHSFHFETAMTLREYAARTSPNDHTQFSPVTMLHIPKRLFEEIGKFRGIRFASDNSTLAWKTQQPAPDAAIEVRGVLESLKKEQAEKVDDLELNHALAGALFARGFLVSSEREFKRALGRDPQNPELRYNLGVLYYNGHVEEQAEKEWLEALRVNPSMGDAHQNLCYLYYQRSRYAEALQHGEAAQQLGTYVSPQLLNELSLRLEGN